MSKEFSKPDYSVSSKEDFEQIYTRTISTLRKFCPEISKEKNKVQDSLHNKKIFQTVKEAEKKFNIPAELILAVISVESGCKNEARSQRGAKGLMQIMPQTAKTLSLKDPYHIKENIMAGSEYLAKMIITFEGSLPHALAAYNSGPGNVKRYGKIPPFKETQLYVDKVLGIYEELRR